MTPFPCSEERQLSGCSDAGCSLKEDLDGMHSIAPKTASANAANAKVRNRQMIGRPIIIEARLEQQLRTLASATFLVWQLRIGACGFWRL